MFKSYFLYIINHTSNIQVILNAFRSEWFNSTFNHCSNIHITFKFLQIFSSASTVLTCGTFKELGDLKIDQGGQIHCSLKTPIWMSSKQQQLNKELWQSLLSVRIFWRKRRDLWIARHHGSTSTHLQVPAHCHLYYWALEKIIQKTSLQYDEGLTPPYTVICFSEFTFFFVNSFYVHITFYSWSKHIVPILTLCLWENPSWLQYSQPPWNPLRYPTGGWMYCSTKIELYAEKPMMRDSSTVITRNIMVTWWVQILHLGSYQKFWQWYITLRITRFLDYDNHFISKTCSFNSLIYYHCENWNTSNSQHNVFILIWDYG
jgi:hypothetical protein